MKKYFLYISNIVRKIPSDVKQTVSAFFASCFIMAVALLVLSLASGGGMAKTEDQPAYNFKLCGLEPYLEQQRAKNDFAFLSYAVILPTSSSEELTEELLAHAIEENTAGESYAVRVSFGAVLLNRVSDSSFPGTLSEVLEASDLYPASLDNDVSERSRHAARDAMLGVDPTVGALYMISVSDPLYEKYKSRVTALYGSYAFLG